MKEQYLIKLIDYLRQFEGSDIESLLVKQRISSSSKSKNYILSKALLYSFEGKDIAEAKIEKYKLNIKTIQLKENGSPKEAMSFAPIDFTKIVGEQWYESEFRNYLSNDFIFFIFKINGQKNELFKIIHWCMPLEDLDGETKLVWEDTKKKISEGTIIKEIANNKIITWFLGQKVTNICHVRPHGANGADVIKLPVSDRLTGYDHVLKHSFWFNQSYIKTIIYGKPTKGEMQ